MFFKAAEHAYGRPKQQVGVERDLKFIQWPDDQDISENDGRFVYFHSDKAGPSFDDRRMADPSG